jgi:geranylgeranyl pyrophosphate synthase
MKVDDLAQVLGMPDLTKNIELVNDELLSCITRANKSLFKPTQRIIESRGKRLRPILVLATSISLGSRISERAIIASSAIELTHIASLVHDDIIDEANLRHGIPTISSLEGTDAAILVGDYLTALAGLQAARVGNEVALAVSTAFACMCDGQSLELTDTYNAGRTIDDYLRTIHNKTASLMGAACQIGGICAGMTDKQIAALASYGEAFGMSFQLIDDLLDLTATTSEVGKPVGNDLKEGIYTMPLLFSLRGSSKDLVHSWLGQQVSNPTSKEKIIQTLRQDSSISKTMNEIQHYNALATQSLASFRHSDIIDGLKNLPEAYLAWSQLGSLAT